MSAVFYRILREQMAHNVDRAAAPQYARIKRALVSSLVRHSVPNCVLGSQQNATSMRGASYARSISSTVPRRTLAPCAHCSQFVSSRGEWLMPPMLGTKIIPIGES